MERKILIFLLFEGVMNAVSGQTPVLQIIQPATEVGSNFTLQCTVTINKAIEFQLNNTGQGSCSAPFLGMLGTCTPSDITQNLTTAVTSWTISPAQPEHDGKWICALGSTDSNEADLQIYQLPGSIITQNGISSDVIVNDTSSYPIVVEVDCLFSGNGPIVELQFAATVNTSVAMTCTTLSTVCSACTGCSAYNCSIILNKALISGQISVNTAYTLYIKVGVTGTTEKFTKPISSPHTVKFERTNTVSKESKAIEDILYEILKYIAKANAPASTATGSGSGVIQKYSMVKFTSTVAEKWHFSNRYILCGTVVYGIQIVLVSSVINTVTIAIGVGVLVYYYEQFKCIAILYLFLLAAAFSIVGVSIYMLILIFFGNKDFMHIKCKKREEDKKLSAHGMKLTNDKNIFIYFKVKAIYASITLHIIEHIGSKPNKRQLKRVLPTCCPPQTISNDLLKDSYVLINRNASHTEYQSFYLKCENKTKTITVLDEKYNEIEQWTIIADSFEIGDIEISNTKQDDSTKDDSTNDNSRKDDSTNDNSAKDNSTNDNSTKDNSTENEKEKLDTTEEWIFWFREGDTLCEIGEHERKTKENSRCKQTLLLICVIIFPIAWLVMIVLMVRNCIKSKGKNTDNTDTELGVRLNQNKKEPSEQQIEKQNDTKGKWFDFIWFSCFHNSVKPNSTTDDNKPKAMMPGSFLANSPKGRNLPKLPEIVTQGDEIRKTKKKDKKKKKIKNQDSKMNDKQQSHSDKQDITFQPEIAVPAYTLEAE